MLGEGYVCSQVSVIKVMISWEICFERLIIEAPQCCIDLRSANVCAGNVDRIDG